MEEMVHIEDIYSFVFASLIHASVSFPFSNKTLYTNDSLCMCASLLEREKQTDA